jgi:Uncharacterized protein conserved in bacteria (DUF2147)
MKTGPVTSLRAATSAAIHSVLVMLATTVARAWEAPQPNAVGMWERMDSSGAQAAWFRILDCNGIFQGKMVKVFSSPPGHNPADWRCTSCTGDQSNAPVIGLTFIDGMKRNGLAYERGSILDPRSAHRLGLR